jgi:integrase
MDGWDIATVSARLGHADVATTMRIYVHEFERAQRSADRRDRLALLYADTDHEAAGELVTIGTSDGDLTT